MGYTHCGEISRTRTEEWKAGIVLVARVLGEEVVGSAKGSGNLSLQRADSG